MRLLSFKQQKIKNTMATSIKRGEAVRGATSQNMTQWRNFTAQSHVCTYLK